jgi:hypothetical protein
MLKFSDIVKIKKSGCAKCLSLFYSLPCQIDRNITKYFTNFGKPVYPLKSVSLLRIDANGGYHIEGRLNAKVIKFVMPKKFNNTDLNKAVRKIEFESCLVKWISNKLNIQISMED